ncbi:class I SAM-dependent methyltransferase [Ensifer sp. LBL]|uniref:class I SAM-dependent methyltransferase n=1 Tax=Ensifer sp. LBL TaxID=2991056 RepID=UPI003D19177D
MNKATFSPDVPGHQPALDIFRGGWSVKLPDELGLSAGSHEHFNDPRIAWAGPTIKGFSGKRILELGPFEAYNTCEMERLGAEVTAIEGSADNFFKCLIMKNVFNLRATFLYGDFNKHELADGEGYDVLWASGVLYHMVDPIAFLRKAATLSRKMFLWTQYFDASVMTPDHPSIGHFDEERNVIVHLEGRDITLHWRSYLEIKPGQPFSGGSSDFSYWMELPDILFVLDKLGFDGIQMGVNNPAFPPGPACFFLASSNLL